MQICSRVQYVCLYKETLAPIFFLKLFIDIHFPAIQNHIGMCTFMHYKRAQTCIFAWDASHIYFSMYVLIQNIYAIFIHIHYIYTYVHLFFWVGSSCRQAIHSWIICHRISLCHILKVIANHGLHATPSYSRAYLKL